MGMRDCSCTFGKTELPTENDSPSDHVDSDGRELRTSKTIARDVDVIADVKTYLAMIPEA